MAFKSRTETTETLAPTTDILGNRTIYKIPEANYPQFQKELTKLSKRSERLVGSAITAMTVGREIVDGLAILDVYLVAPQPIVGKWAFVARIDHTNDTGNIVRTVPNMACEIPAHYRDASPNCDHCGHKRLRRDTFILWDRETGMFNQVGSTCLEKFFAHNPFAEAKLAELLGYADEIAKANNEPRGGEAYLNDYRWVNVEHYLAHVARTIRLFGWVSGTRAYNEGITSTKIRAEASYLRGAGEDHAPMTKDRAIAEEALEWARLLADKDDKDDYEHNIAVVAGSTYIEHRSLGLAASIVGVYLGKKAKEATPRLPSQHVGKVGDKVKGEATLTLISGYDSDFGYTNIYRFTAPSGNVLVWKTTTKLNYQVGDKVVVRGTVKKHDEYKGVKQTVLTRCNVEVV